jgi:predicted MFS family arabinose efflux permease
VRRGPLADSYPGAAALVVCSLIPYLALTAAVFPLAHVLAASLGLSLSTLYITISVSTGGYAMGTVLALQFAVHLPARRMLVVYEVIFFLAAVLTAWAPTGGVFIGGFIVLGLCTSLMLIAAVPPSSPAGRPSRCRSPAGS